MVNAPGAGGSPNADPLLSCLSKLGFRELTTYQPGSRYWAFQGIETGIYVLSPPPLAVAFVVRHRDACRCPP